MIAGSKIAQSIIEQFQAVNLNSEVAFRAFARIYRYPDAIPTEINRIITRAIL